MPKRLIKLAAVVVAMAMVGLLVLVGYQAVRGMGWLSAIGIESESRDSQVIRALKRTEEVSLLSLGVQGIREEEESRTVFGQSIPGTGRQLFLQYEFTAKLGIDGAQVNIERIGGNAYRITVPEFQFIGYDEPEFQVAVEDGGALAWVTPDIDQLEVVNDLLNDEARDTYLSEYEEDLRAQAQVFYDGILASVDPAIETEYEFG